MPLRKASKAPSSAENLPKCVHFARGVCTGCTRLDVRYATQLAAKHERVAAALAPHLGDVALTEIAASPAVIGYRTSVKWCLNEDREGRRAVGLYQKGSKTVVPVADCPAAHPAIVALTAKLFGGARLRHLPARLYDHRGRAFQKGRLKFLVVRHAPPDGFGAILAHTGVPSDALRAWLEGALGDGGLERDASRAAPSLADVAFYETQLLPQDGGELLGKVVRPLAGATHFPLTVGGTTFALTPAAFFQANASLSDRLVAAATAFAADGDVLLDLYGGFGAYAFAVRSRFREIHVVDGNEAAVLAARRAAKALGVKHVHAHAMFCERFLAGMPEAARLPVSHVLVNPPRSGLSRDVLAALAPSRFPALREAIYVSCHPDTLARDVGVLRAAGWRVAAARAFDMFPQTDHVETVVRLER
jgi:23S rRNA (uracil-5-)-methyltransferase RumA